MKKIALITLLTSAAYLAIPFNAEAHKIDCSYFYYPKGQVLSLEESADLLYNRIKKELRQGISVRDYASPSAKRGAWIKLKTRSFDIVYNDKRLLSKETTDTIIRSTIEIASPSVYLLVTSQFNLSTMDFMVSSIDLDVHEKCPLLGKPEVRETKDGELANSYSPKVTQGLRDLVGRIYKEAIPHVGPYHY